MPLIAKASPITMLPRTPRYWAMRKSSRRRASARHKALPTEEQCQGHHEHERHDKHDELQQRDTKLTDIDLHISAAPKVDRLRTRAVPKIRMPFWMM